MSLSQKSRAQALLRQVRAAAGQPPDLGPVLAALQRPTALVGIYRWHYAPADVTFLRFCFRGRIEGVEDRALDPQIAALHWLTREELLARRTEHRSPLVQRCVDDYLAGRQFALDIFPAEYA